MHQFVESSSAPHSFQAGVGLDLLATAYHKGIMKRLDKCVDMPVSLRPLLRYCQQRVAEALPTTAQCWQPEIGAAMSCMGRDLPGPALLHALFALHALRVPGSWRCTLDAPLRTSVMGHFFELDGEIAVDGDADLLTISRAGCAAPLLLRWDQGGWRHAGVQAPEADWRYAAPAFVAHDQFPNLYVQGWQLSPTHVQGDEIIVGWPPQPAPATDAAASARQLDAALVILGEIGPGYLPWVQPLLRGIAACTTPTPDARISASFASHAGVFSSGFPLSDDFIAENIVHEVSHQHFLLIDACIPLVTPGQHESPYFSSLKKKPRSLKKIFMAYHALVNMALYWYDYRARYGALSAVQESEMDYVLYNVPLQAEVVDGNPDVTAAGATMFRVQQGLLRERGLAA